jgi:haloacetate dehalogenase
MGDAEHEVSMIAKSATRSVRTIGPAPLMPGFELHDVDVGEGVTIRAAVAGEGPPLLLLHGHPHTHVTWRKVGPRLAERFTVVAADLRGYGDSSKPEGGGDHFAYSRRVMAVDQVTVMRALGHERFALVGHDRGARVSHRLTLDHPNAVSRIALFNISPTATMYARTDKTFATSHFWWFFLIQPAPLPEHMINGDRAFFLRDHLDGQVKTPGALEPAAFAEYLRCYDKSETVHAICEDYRAAAGIDLEHDAADADRRIDAPLLALWGAKDAIARQFDVLGTWREKARDVSGGPLDCGHILQEERPDEVLEHLTAFLT